MDFLHCASSASLVPPLLPLDLDEMEDKEYPSSISVPPGIEMEDLSAPLSSLVMIFQSSLRFTEDSFCALGVDFIWSVFSSDEEISSNEIQQALGLEDDEFPMF